MDKKKKIKMRLVVSIVLAAVLVSMIPMAAFGAELTAKYNQYNTMPIRDDVQWTINKDNVVAVEQGEYLKVGKNMYFGDKQFSTVRISNKKFNFGTDSTETSAGSAYNSTTASDGYTAIRKTDGTWDSCTFRIKDGVLINGTTKADILVKVYNVQVRLGRFKNGGNSSLTADRNYACNVLLVSGNYIDMCAPNLTTNASNPRTSGSSGNTLNSQGSVRLFLDVKLVKTGTDTPIDQNNIVMATADFDQGDYLYRSGWDSNTDFEFIDKGWADSITTGSGFYGNVYLANNTLVNKNRNVLKVTTNDNGNSVINIGYTAFKEWAAANNNSMPNETYYNGFFGTTNNAFTLSATTSGQSYSDAAFIVLGKQKLVNVKLQGRKGSSGTYSVSGYPGTITKGTGGKQLSTGRYQYQLNTSTTYTYTPKAGYSVTGLTVDGADQTFTATGGTYTMPRIYRSPLESSSTDIQFNVTFSPNPATVTVKYVDGNGNPVAEEKTLTGVTDDPYNTTAETVPGYTLVTTPTNASGTMLGDKVVTYVYTASPATVTVKYVDESGNPIAPDDVLTGVTGDPYTTSAKTVSGYELKSVSGDESGTMSGNKVVTYTYKQTSSRATVSVLYVDEQDNPVAEGKFIQGNEGDSYTTAPKKVPGYALKEIPDNANGTMAGDLCVKYIYRDTRITLLPEFDENTVYGGNADVTDELKEIEYIIFKEDQDGNALEGATFQIKALVDIYNRAGEKIVSAGDILATGTTSIKDESEKATTDFGTRFPTYHYADKDQYEANGGFMYEIVETDAPDGYTAENAVIKKTGNPDIDRTGTDSGSGITTCEMTVENTENDSITIQKVWAGYPETGSRPTSIFVDVYNGSTCVKANVELNESNNWKQELRDVPRTSGGTTIHYTFVEKTSAGQTSETVPNGYTVKYNFTKGICKITNTGKQGKASVEKIWEDTDESGTENADGIRPESVEVDLIQTDSAGNETIYVPDASHKVTKTVPDGQEDSAGLSVYANKTGYDENTHTATYEDYIPYTLSASNNWKLSFTGLPVKNNSGDIVTYRFVERTTDIINGNAVTGYSISADTKDTKDSTVTKITNKHTPSTVTAKLTKNWDRNGSDASDVMIPESIQVRLLQNGQPYTGSYKLAGETKTNAPVITISGDRDNDKWECSVAGLPKFAEGEIAAYTFEEVTDEIRIGNGTWELDTDSTASENNSTEMTNRYKLNDKISVQVNKYWEDGLSGTDAENREYPTFTLQGVNPDDASDVITITSTNDLAQTDEGSGWIKNNDSTWTYRFADLDDKYEYTVTESSYDDYKVSVNGSETATADVVNNEAGITNTKETTRGLTVTKVITGITSDPEKEFDFTAEFNGLKEDTTYEAILRKTDGTTTKTRLASDATGKAIAAFKLADKYEWNIEGLPAGATCVVSEDTDSHNYEPSWTLKYKDENGIPKEDAAIAQTGASDNNKRTVTISEDREDQTLICTNTSNEVRDLSVTKVVTGNMGDRSRRFGFAVTLTGLKADTTYTGKYTFANGEERQYTYEANENGLLSTSIVLRHGEVWTLEEVPVGTSYSVTENNIEQLPYTVSYSYQCKDNANQETTEVLSGAPNKTIEMDEYDPTVIVTNHNEVNIPTGLVDNMKGLPIWILASAVVILGLLKRFKFKKI